MSRTFLACFLALAVIERSLAVGPPPRPTSVADMQQLVNQLGDRSYRVRDTADKRLRSLGTDALPVLRKALGHKDPEIRRRALNIVPILEQRLLVAPKRVTLIVQNQPLNKVLDELSKQSGYKVTSDGNVFFPGLPGARPPAKGKERNYTYRFVNAPFWDVVDRICRDGKLSVQPSWGDETIRLFRSNGHAPFAGRDGAFRYSATNIQMYRSVDLSSSEPAEGRATLRNETLTLNFQVYAEPRLPFLNMGEPRIESAYDNERNSMVPTTEVIEDNNPWGGRAVRFSRRLYGGGYKQYFMQSSLSLERKSAKATTLKVLRGVLPVTLLVKQEPLVITDKVMSSQGTKKVVSDLEFNIQEVKKQGAGVQIKFQVTNKGKTNDFNWMNNLYSRVELQDAKGVKYANWGSSWHGGGGNSATLTLTFNPQAGAVKAGEPARFVYTNWVTRTHDINFEFRDVPLP